MITIKKYISVPLSIDLRGTVMARINPKHAIIRKNRLTKNFLLEKDSFLPISLHPHLNWKLVIACGQPTINDENCSRCKTGFIGCEEEGGICDINRLPNPS